VSNPTSAPDQQPSRQALFERYRQISRSAADNSELRLVDNWRMPNNADVFNLSAFADYLDANGEALAELLDHPFENGQPKKP
jgi:hypothetical protein